MQKQTVVLHTHSYNLCSLLFVQTVSTALAAGGYDSISGMSKLVNATSIWTSVSCVVLFSVVASQQQCVFGWETWQGLIACCLH